MNARVDRKIENEQFSNKQNETKLNETDGGGVGFFFLRKITKRATNRLLLIASQPVNL